MADNFGGPFAGVATPAGVCVQTSQTNIIAEVNKVKALIPDITVAQSGAHPDFDEISPNVAQLLRAELDALNTAIDAMAIA